MSNGHIDPIIVEAYSFQHKMSKYFTFGEMIKSNTAVRYDIDNEPDEEQIQNLKNLCNNVLDPIREGLGSPVIISSGFRSHLLNVKIGGSPTSQHVKGEAADLDVVGYNTTQVFEWIVLESNIIWDQIIWEYGHNGWVHISYTNRYMNRQLITTAKSKNGRTVYEHWTKEAVKQGNIYG